MNTRTHLPRCGHTRFLGRSGHPPIPRWGLCVSVVCLQCHVSAVSCACSVVCLQCRVPAVSCVCSVVCLQCRVSAVSCSCSIACLQRRVSVAFLAVYLQCCMPYVSGVMYHRMRVYQWQQWCMPCFSSVMYHRMRVCRWQQCVGRWRRRDRRPTAQRSVPVYLMSDNLVALWLSSVATPHQHISPIYSHIIVLLKMYNCSILVYFIQFILD